MLWDLVTCGMVVLRGACHQLVFLLDSPPGPPPIKALAQQKYLWGGGTC